MSTPVRTLVGQLTPVIQKESILDGELTFALFDQAGPVGAEAVGKSDTGLDLFAGERVLAGVLARDTPKGHEHRLSVAITDRRTILSGWSDIKGGLNDKRWSVFHTEIQQVETKESMLANYVALHAPSGKHLLTFPKLTKQLDWFYKTLTGQIPPDQRREPPTPFVSPTPDDPAGARSAIDALWTPDAACQQMLTRVDERVRAGEIPAEAGADLVGRVVLAHRGIVSGPGMSEGAWVSAMSSQDLGHSLVRIFGNPLAHT